MYQDPSGNAVISSAILIGGAFVVAGLVIVYTAVFVNTMPAASGAPFSINTMPSRLKDPLSRAYGFVLGMPLYNTLCRNHILWESNGLKTVPEGDSEAGEKTSGKSRAPETGKTGSTYEQVDDKGNVMSRTKYGENGRPEYRDDLTGRPHYDKTTGEYLNQHRHTFEYNDIGQPIGEKVTPIPGCNGQAIL